VVASPASSRSGALASASQASVSHFAIVVNGQQVAVFAQLVGPELSDWHDDAIQNGSRAWKDADIIMFDQTAQPLARWHLVNAWPSKYAVDTLAAGGQEVAMETVTFVSERLVRVSA
jgi:phage tail-like protein